MDSYLNIDLDLYLKEIQELGTYLNESAKLKCTLSLVESNRVMRC